MSVVNASFDQPLQREEQASMPLAGGIEQMGFQCGQLWGAALAAGARAYQLFGSVPQAEAGAAFAARRLAESFRTSYKSINYLDVVELDWKNPNATQMLRHWLRRTCEGCALPGSEMSELDFMLRRGLMRPATGESVRRAELPDRICAR